MNTSLASYLGLLFSQKPHARLNADAESHDMPCHEYTAPDFIHHHQSFHLINQWRRDMPCHVKSISIIMPISAERMPKTNFQAQTPAMRTDMHNLLSSIVKVKEKRKVLHMSSRRMTGPGSKGAFQHPNS
jgi:hypothetical protein